jgi:hypothetical protein
LLAAEEALKNLAASVKVLNSGLISKEEEV